MGFDYDGEINTVNSNVSIHARYTLYKFVILLRRQPKSLKSMRSNSNASLIQLKEVDEGGKTTTRSACDKGFK